jgi:2-oxoglutarate ferredoxin oxidoreductase subunit alpha
LRYRVTESGVSPMSLPGMKGGQYTAEGLEKMESGAPEYTPELHTRNFHKRDRKIKNALKDYMDWHMYEEFGDKDAPVAIVGWGSTIGPVREAVARAKAEGMPVAVLYPKLLSPLPHDHIAQFMEGREAVIVPELNFTGQLARMLQADFGREFIRLNKYTGTPFSTLDVYNKIKEVYESIKQKVG